MAYWRLLMTFFLIIYSWSLHAQDTPKDQGAPFNQRLKLAFAPTIIKPLFTPLIDCPFDVAIMKKQALHQPYRLILSQTYKTQGFKGFYQGFFAKFSGSLIKNLYTWPTYSFAPCLFQTCFPSLFTTHPGVLEGISALSIAIIDMIVQTPLEYIRVGQILTPNQFHWKSLYTLKIRDLYRGSLLTFHQSFFSTYIFFMMEKGLRTKAQNQANTHHLSWFHYASIGTTLSLIQTTVTLPFSTIRVKLQAQDTRGLQGPMLKGKEIFMETWRKGGARYLYAGGWLKFIRSAMVYSLDSYFLNSIDTNGSRSLKEVPPSLSH